MNGYRAIAGLCALCALLVSAFAAQSASAVGTTAYTCAAGGSKDFASSDHHCRTSLGPGKGTLGHVAIANTTTTPASLNNQTTGGAKETAKLHAVINGVLTEITAGSIETTEGAWMENTEEGGEMFAHGEGKLVLNEVKVVKPPNCWVKSALGVAVIETNQVKVTTKGQGDSLQFIPAAGTVFAEFAIETNGGGLCSASLNPTKVVGSVNGTPEGATTKFDSTAVTNGGTLRINSASGPKAGLAGSVTISAAKIGEETRPIAMTT